MLGLLAIPTNITFWKCFCIFVGMIHWYLMHSLALDDASDHSYSSTFSVFGQFNHAVFMHYSLAIRIVVLYCMMALMLIDWWQYIYSTVAASELHYEKQGRYISHGHAYFSKWHYNRINLAFYSLSLLFLDSKSNRLSTVNANWSKFRLTLQILIVNRSSSW